MQIGPINKTIRFSVCSFVLSVCRLRVENNMLTTTVPKGGNSVSYPLSKGRSFGAPSRLNAVPKKLNTLDEGWRKKFFGYGYFSEDQEEATVNIFERLERKKVLSSVESAGLLSAAERAGLTLGKIEKLGLLSTAEKLGALSVAEEALAQNPGTITSLSIPFLVAAIGALVVIPSDNILEIILRYGVAGALGTGFLVFFAGGFILAALQDEE